MHERHSKDAPVNIATEGERRKLFRDCAKSFQKNCVKSRGNRKICAKEAAKFCENKYYPKTKIITPEDIAAGKHSNVILPPGV